MKPKRQINLDPDRLNVGRPSCTVPLVIIGALVVMVILAEVVARWVHCCYFIGR